MVIIIISYVEFIRFLILWSKKKLTPFNHLGIGRLTALRLTAHNDYFSLQKNDFFENKYLLLLL